MEKTMAQHFMEFAFTDSVRKMQDQYGTRDPYKKMEEKTDFRNKLTWQEKAYIKGREDFYMSSVGENGWPYMQFRGGPKGFLKVIDANTLAFADFRGNGQYISAGNFTATKKTVLFMMDYANQQRLKIWAEVDVLHASDNPELMEKVQLPDYKAAVERIFVLKVHAFDWNCPQHITPRFTKEEIQSGAIRIDSETMETGVGGQS
jgi:predicted pyridoxine 5'-phosphate oxidase superfamily flavin-nucleotide-binding protein